MTVRKKEEEVFPNAAGIDVGASSHWVAIPRNAMDDWVREFGCVRRTRSRRSTAI